MEIDTDKSITLRDSETIIGGNQAHGSNVTAVLNSISSTVKINSLSINLGIFKGKDDSQKCSHFSIRGYVSKMREKGGNNYLPFTDGNKEELPPMDVPHFRYWLCQSCLQDYGGGSTSQEVALVSQYGKSMMQPCRTSYSSPNCHGLPIVLPFGEGTSGHKPVDERINGDEHILTVIQEKSTQLLPENFPVVEELDKIDSIDNDITLDANVVDDYKKVGIPDGSLTFSVQSTESDQQNHDITGHPRRKARKVRLLTELLCGSTEKQHHIHRKESTNLPELTPTPSSPLKKRKMPQVHEWRPVDVTSQSHVAKKVKLVKGNVAVKTSIVDHSQDLEASENEGGHNTDKYQCKKHGTQKSLKHGKVSSDSVAVWRSIFNDMGRSDNVKVNSLPNDSSRPNHDISKGKRNDMFLEKKSNPYKKVMENHYMRNQLFGDDIQRTNAGDSRVRDSGQCQSDTALGLGLSLNYDSQSRVSWMPPLPNRVPIHACSRKDGFFFGESSIGHKGVVLDSQVNGRSVYNVRDGNIPRTSFLQDQQPFHAQLSHGSFSQHQNLDFSDPHNKRNNGVRGYSDLMRAHNYQRQDVFSNGRSDEREIVELMAKIQHERNLSEVKSYNEISNSSKFHKINTFHQGISIPHHQYPTIRRPSSSTIPTNAFFHQEPNPSFPNFDTFSQNHIRVSDNSHYNESRENYNSAPTNMQIMEAYNNGRPGNVWSNMEMHTKWSNRNKGKNIMNLDLNVMAPNVLEDQNHTGSLDHSYSNEAIPAMQLLSLMDAGKNPPIMEKKKPTKKPFSCYNGIKQNSFSYSGMQSGVIKPVENSRNFIVGHGACSHSLPVTNSFSSFFQTDQTVRTHGSQFFHKPQEKKQGVSVIGHKYSPEDSFGFPLPWHASEGGALGTRNVRLETEICTINQNPADFSTPGPENVYMIDVENLKFRGDHVFYPREGTV